MQKTRKLISLLLAVMMVLSMCTVGMVSVSALPEDAIINDAEGNDASGIDGDIFGLMGDTDDNDTVNVKDATQIQKFAAKLIELDEASTALADVNLDDKVNVKDATAIQKWVAKFDVEEPINCLVYIPAAEPTTVATVPTTVAPTETTAVETKPTIPVIIPTTVATEPSEVPTTAKPTEAPATTVAPTTAKPTEAPATTVAPTTAAPTTVKPTEAPAEKVTIYFTNNQGWEVVNIYYWGGTGAASAEWPGQEMTYVETSDLGQDIYSYEIAADVAGIVFNGKESATSEKGNNYQTVDITEGIVNNAGFYPEEQKVDPEGPDNDKWICGTYTYESKEEITTEADDVVGPGYYLVGTIGGQELMTADTLTADRKLTQASNGDYVLFWTTTGGDEYKVAYYDGTEITKLFKAEGEDPYIIGKESNKIGYCKVEFNPEGKDNWSYKYMTINVTTERPDDPEDTGNQDATQKPQGEKSLILLRGDFNDWKGDDLTFYKTSDPDVVTITIELEAGKYEFKLRDRNGESLWYGNPGTIKDTTYPDSKNGWEMKETDGNCTLEATGGTYTFNFNTSTKKLTVLHNVPVVTDPVETTKVDEQETTKVDQQETTKVDEQETTKVDEQETTQKPQGEKSLIILRGDFNNWEGEKDTFLTTSNPDIVTVTIELEAGTYNFKLRDRSGDDLWYGNNGTIKDSTGEGGWTFTKTEGMGGHCTLEATGGTYTFNFNTSTKKLVVLHNGSVVTDPIEDNTDNDDPDVVDAGYYLVGKLNGKEYWDAASITADRKLKETSTEGEYKLNWTFYDGDQVKVVYFDGTSIKTWYKDNADNYNIDSKKAGDGVLYFRPEGNDSWSYTFFTVQPANPNESEPDSEPSSVTTDPQTSSSVAIVTDPIETESTATEPSSSSEATESQPASSSSEATESQPASSEVVDPVIPAYEVHVAEGRGFKLLGALSLAEGSKTVLEATFEFEAGNIGFKIKDADNTKWYGGATTFTDACENVVFTTSKDLATLVATGGTYKFTVDASDADNLVVKVEKIAGIDNPDEKVTIYLKQDGIDWLLNTADKRVAKLIDNDTQTEYTMSVVGDAWVVEVPSSVTDITFKRFKGDDLRNTWNAGERGTDVTYYVMDDYSGRWENQELDTYTVYFINASNWSKVCAYAWTGGTNGGGWPGKEMTETGVQVNGFDVYSVEFNAEFEKIQFNNGSNSAQIDNLTFKTGKYFDARSNEWYDTLADVPAVGALATNRFLLGDFNGWNATEYEFKLKAEGDSVGYVELELEANKTYDFKIIREGTWTSCTTFVTETVEGLQFSSSNGDNCKITTKSAGTYVFAFGLNDSKLSVTYP